MGRAWIIDFLWCLAASAWLAFINVRSKNISATFVDRFRYPVMHRILRGRVSISVPTQHAGWTCSRFEISCLRKCGAHPDYWFTNARVQLIKKCMKIGFWQAYPPPHPSAAWNTRSSCVTGKEMHWKDYQTDTLGESYGVRSGLPIPVNSLALPARHSCLLLHRQMAPTNERLMQHLFPPPPLLQFDP